MAEQFNIIAEQDNCTVVTKYEPQQRSGNAYQSEAELEQWLITLLQHQGYEYPTIRNEEELLLNLRKELGEVNDIVLSDKEWSNLLQEISNDTLTLEDKDRKSVV